MTRSKLLLSAFLVLTGVVVWLVWRGDSGEAGVRAEGDPAVTGTVERAGQPEPPPVATADGRDASPRAPAEPAPAPPSAPGQAQVETRDVAAEIAARQRPSCMRRLGWSIDDPRGAFVARWVTDKLAADAESFDRIGSLGNAGRADEMREFNQSTQARRLQLVQSLGVEAAQAVADEFCLYQFDPQVGSWHRIDALGRRVPFKHEDDDIWQGFESSNPDWNNHASR